MPGKLFATFVIVMVYYHNYRRFNLLPAKTLHGMKISNETKIGALAAVSSRCSNPGI